MGQWGSVTGSRDGSSRVRVILLAVAMVVCIGMVGYPAPVRAGDWVNTDLPFVEPGPLRTLTSQWVGWTMYAGESRTAIEEAGHRSVVRTLALLPSLILSPPNWQLQPFIGAGVGLSISDLTPGFLYTPLQLDHRLMVQAGAGLAYHLGQGWAFTSSARFFQFKSANILGALTNASSPLREVSLDFRRYMVEVGIRFTY